MAVVVSVVGDSPLAEEVYLKIKEVLGDFVVKPLGALTISVEIPAVEGTALSLPMLMEK
jgi:hypothetical protein